MFWRLDLWLPQACPKAPAINNHVMVASAIVADWRAVNPALMAANTCYSFQDGLNVYMWRVFTPTWPLKTFRVSRCGGLSTAPSSSGVYVPEPATCADTLA
jgi:hypothetical protein